MRELAPEILEPLLVVFYGALVSVLTVAGLGAELLGFFGLLAGDGGTASLWLIYMGAIGLAAALLVARRRLLPMLGSASA